MADLRWTGSNRSPNLREGHRRELGSLGQRYHGRVPCPDHHRGVREQRTGRPRLRPQWLRHGELLISLTSASLKGAGA